MQRQASTPASLTSSADPAHVVRSDQLIYAFAPKRVWSAFLDFPVLCRRFSDFRDFRPEPSNHSQPHHTSAREVGYKFSVDFHAVRHFLTVFVADPTAMEWGAALDTPTTWFQSYRISFKASPTISDDEGTTTLSVHEDFVLAEPMPQFPPSSPFDLLTPRQRIRELVDFLVDRDGSSLHFGFVVKRALPEMWAVIGNWSDVSWVQNAVDVVVDDTGSYRTRTIKFPHGELFEVLHPSSHTDAAKPTVTLTIERGFLPVALLRNTTTLSPATSSENLGQGNNSMTNNTQMDVHVRFIPKHGADPEKVANGLKSGLGAWFEWLRTAFARPTHGDP